MNLPEDVKDFINKKVELENYCLPHFYPELNSFEDFQIGYKINGISGEKETGDGDGDFKENWFVICAGYASDPFFIDITEADKKFPVYFSWRGAGKWIAIKVAENINEFSEKLLFLKDLETKNNNIQEEFRKSFDMNNKFWMEVYNGYEEEVEVYSNHHSPTENEKRIQEIRKELKVLDENKEKGKIELKSYLIYKRELENEIKELS
ncbi:SMI1/KNR4 family protein [uncultured Aquimarina sp.]|uniref:SMI1/KNR4 family protein n=1 Tax=uncultured Aquimarina sp. TaxID=575652 RepID=UPI002606C029|nr:SMI1/KNR4 family protein [uncultured Aquimarina sp.]